MGTLGQTTVGAGTLRRAAMDKSGSLSPFRDPSHWCLGSPPDLGVASLAHPCWKLWENTAHGDPTHLIPSSRPPSLLITTPRGEGFWGRGSSDCG